MDNYNQDNNYYSSQDYQQPYGADNSQNNSYQQPYGTGYNQTPSYQQPNYNNINNDDERVSVLMWIGVFCINLIPCVGSLVYIIMMFVWAFGSTPKKSLKNYARA